MLFVKALHDFLFCFESVRVEVKHSSYNLESARGEKVATSQHAILICLLKDIQWMERRRINHMSENYV